MKIAYVFKTDQSSTFQLNSMILPQLEQGNHMVDVIGMFFFDDNILCLQKGNAFGERLAKIAKEKNIRQSAKKMNFVLQSIKKLNVDDALKRLSFMNKKAAFCISKTLSSAVGTLFLFLDPF